MKKWLLLPALGLLLCLLVSLPGSAAGEPWLEETYWNNAFLLDEPEDFEALGRIVNRAEPTLADVQRFLPAAVEGDLTEDLFYNFSQGKYALGADVTLTANMPSIGTATNPFMGQISGQGHTITYTAVKTGPEVGSAALFGYAQNPAVGDALFYNLTVHNSITVNNNTANSAVVGGGVVAHGGSAILFRQVTTTGKLTVSTPTADIASMTFGGLVGKLAPGATLLSTDCAPRLQTVYPNVKATSPKVPAPLETEGNLPTAQPGTLAVQQMQGVTIYAFGKGVTGGEGGVYTVEPGTTVRIVAVNETREFARWTGYRTGTTYTDSFVMPAGGSGVSLGCHFKPLLETGRAAEGRSFDTAYVIDEASDLTVLAEIINSGVMTNSGEFTAATVDRTQMQSAYYKVTASFATAPGYVSIGTNTATSSFKGFIDGSGPTGNHSITIKNTAVDTGNYGGLFGQISGTATAYSLVRNLSVIGDFISTSTEAGDGYYGSLAGNAAYTIFKQAQGQMNLSLGSATKSGAAYVGGLVGYGGNLYMGGCTFSAERILSAAASDKNAFCGGLFGYASDSVIRDSDVKFGRRFGENMSGYETATFQSGSETGNAATGGLAGYLHSTSTTGTFPISVSGCRVTRLDDGDTYDKYILAKSNGKSSFAGGLFGVVDANTPDTRLTNNQILMEGKALLKITAGDDQGNANAASAYSGGIAAAMFKNGSAFGSATNSPDTTLRLIYTDGKKPFDGGMEITSRAYGKGTSHFAGGISGRNFCDISRLGTLDLSNMTIRIEEKSTTTGTSAATIPPAVGGAFGFISSAVNVNGLTITGENTYIEFLREDKSTRIGHIAVGGAIGYYGSSTTGIGNVSLTLKDSTVALNQRAYSSTTGNSALGGIVGYSLAKTHSNLTVTALGTTTFAGSTATGVPGASQSHNNADVYVGGIVGWTANTTGPEISQCQLTGAYATNPAVKTVSLTANQSTNSPSVGGILGYGMGDIVQNCTVTSAYVYGESFNPNTTTTDTDIIVGGAVGLVSTNNINNTNYYPQLLRCKVEASKIEAYGRAYTLTYAGGILGAHFSPLLPTSPLIDHCVSTQNLTKASAQKKWAAVGGIIGYIYEKNAPYLIANSGSFGDTLECYNNGDKTYHASGKAFEGLTIGGGIVGRLNRDFGEKTLAFGLKLQNCYSDAKIILVNPDPDKVYRGGLVGFKRYDSSKLNCGVVFDQAFFNAENAGTQLAMDMSTSKGEDPEDGIQRVVPGPVQMETVIKDGELVEYAALNFSPEIMDTPTLEIFQGVMAEGAAVGTLESPIVSAREGQPSPSLLTSILPNTAGTPVSFQVVRDITSVGETYAEMLVSINGEAYSMGKKPLFLGELIAADLDLFKGTVETGVEVVNPTTYPLPSGAPALLFSANVDYDNLDPALDKDLVQWEFSHTADFAQILTASAMQGYATITIQGNACTVDPSVPLAKPVTFYMRAKAVCTSGLNGAPAPLSPVLTIAINPIGVTEIQIQDIPADNGPSLEESFPINEKTPVDLDAVVGPPEATLNSYYFVGYKVNQSTGETIYSPVSLAGVKSDGSISPQVLKNSDKIANGQYFVIYAVSNGWAKDAASIVSPCQPLSSLSPELAGDLRVISKPLYVCFSNVEVKFHVTGGTPKNQPSVAIPGTQYSFSTDPTSGNYSPVPGVAYYEYTTAGGTVKRDFFSLDANGDPVSNWSGGYSLTGATSHFSFRVPTEDVVGGIVHVYVAYFETVELRYHLPDGTVVISSRTTTKFITNRDIPTIQDLETSMKRISSSYEGLSKAYILAGWYHDVNTGNLAKSTATLADYKKLLVPSTQNGDRFENVIVAVGGSYDLYPRLQYKVTLEDSAAVDPTTCANKGEGEGIAPPAEPEAGKAYDYRFGDPLAPPNQNCNYELLLDKPASYGGALRYEVYVGDKLLGPGDYTLQENGGQTKVTIQASQLTLSKLLGVNNQGIRIQVYHTNGQVIPNESPSLFNRDPQGTADGIFTMVYNVNHARRTVTLPNGNPSQLQTYGYANLSAVNDLRLTFSEALPADSLVEIHRAVGYTETSSVPQEIYWARTSPRQTGLTLSQCAPLGGLGGASTRSFTTYLPGLTQGEEDYKPTTERFYVVVTPAPDTTLPAQLTITAALGELALGSLRLDSEPVPLTAGYGTAGTPWESALLITDTPSQSGGTITGGVTADIRRIESTSPLYPNNQRHENSLYGLALYLVDGAGKEILLPADSSISLTPKGTGGTVTRESTLMEPLSRAFFPVEDTVANGAYTYRVEGAPAGSQLVIELIETKPWTNLQTQYEPEEPPYEIIKLEGGILRASKTFP